MVDSILTSFSPAPQCKFSCKKRLRHSRERARRKFAKIGFFKLFFAKFDNFANRAQARGGEEGGNRRGVGGHRVEDGPQRRARGCRYDDR